MANLTVNTKKYGQITLNTKPHSDPINIPGHQRMNNYTFGQSNITNILSISRSG